MPVHAKQKHCKWWEQDRGSCMQEAASCHCSGFQSPTGKELRSCSAYTALLWTYTSVNLQTLKKKGRDTCLQTPSLHPLKLGWRWKSFRRCHLAGEWSGTGQRTGSCLSWHLNSEETWAKAQGLPPPSSRQPRQGVWPWNGSPSELRQQERLCFIGDHRCWLQTHEPPPAAHPGLRTFSPSCGVLPSPCSL